MALAEMCKARIAVHKSVADELAASLQGLGCCEFISRDGDSGHGGALLLPREKRRHVDELIGDAKFLLRLLEPYESKKDGSIGKMLGDIPAKSFAQLAAQVNEKKFTEFTSFIREIEKSLTETRADISRIKGLIAQLSLLENIRYPLEFFTSGTDMISGAVYSVPKGVMSEIAARLKESLGDMSEWQELPCSEKDANVSFALLYQKCAVEKVQEAAAEFGATRIEVPKDFSLTASEEKALLEEKLARCEEKEAELVGKLASNADVGLEMARDYGDYWNILHDRLVAMETGEPTEDVLIWEFWVPKSAMKKVEYAVARYDSCTEFSEVEPEDGEEPPTLLKNASWSSCMEPLTIMYGTPTYGKVDPTALMAPFFFLFLGMCFGDAGYGLVLTGILGYFLVRHNLSPTIRKFFVMMTVGMVVTIIFGAVTGSWFGDSVTAFPFLSGIAPVMKKMQLLDPMNDPMTLLMISLALGFVQIIFGLFIAFSENWKAGDKLAAISDQGGWIIFLCGLALMGCTMSGYLPSGLVLPSKIIALVGALLLVATQGREKPSIFGKIFSGVMSLYNVTGYLGDVLSYSRLLALGLGSAAVGMVINLLAGLVSGVPYVGIVLAVLIFILGHTFSIVVNLLGAFIHSLRLQYVEFFGKFYDATGRDFSPLRNTAQYSRIREDSPAH